MAYLQNATQNLTNYLAQRQLQQRQKMLDEIERADRERRQQRENASDEMQRKRFELDQKMLEEQRARDAQQNARVARQDVRDDATREASMFRVGDIVPTMSKDVMQRGGLGPQVQDSPMTIGRSGVPVLSTFAGTGDQRTAAQQVAQKALDEKIAKGTRLALASNPTRENIRRHELLTGENIPAEDRDPVADAKAQGMDAARAKVWEEQQLSKVPPRATAATAAAGGKEQNAVDNAHEALNVIRSLEADAEGARKAHGTWNATRATGASQAVVDYQKNFNRLKSLLSVGGLESLRGLGPASDTDVRIVTEAATNLAIESSVQARNIEFKRITEAMNRLIVRAEQKGLKSASSPNNYVSTDENWGK